MKLPIPRELSIFTPKWPFMRFARQFLAAAAAFVQEPLRAANEEQRACLNAPAGGRIDGQVTAVMLAVAVCLSLRHYFFPSSPPAWLESTEENHQLAGLSYWALGQFVCYVVGPVALVKLAFRRPLADYGVKTAGVFACWWAYVAMYVGLLPIILWAAHRESFLEMYPFYRLAPGEALWPRFWAWQVLYATQFASLEFFFRGFLLHGCRPRFGPNSILVMTVPYCMIHFGKPLTETLGAIVAGLLLGFMSLKTRSIWMGAGLHIAVAMTMDFAALAQRSS